MSNYNDILSDGEKFTIHKNKNYVTNYIFNQVEHYNSSNYCFLSYLKLLCKEKGYDFDYNEEKSKPLLKKKKDNKINILMNVKCPSQSEYHEIKKNIETLNATEEDKIKLKKYVVLVSDLSYDMDKIRIIEKEFNDRKNDDSEDIENYNEKYKNIIECEKQIKLANKAKNFCCLLNINNIDTNLIYKNINNNLESTKYAKLIFDIQQFLKLFDNIKIFEVTELKNFKETIEKKKKDLNLFTNKIYRQIKKKSENSTKEILAHLNVFLNKFGLIVYAKQKSLRTDEIIHKENKYYLKMIDGISDIINKYKDRAILDSFLDDDYDELFDVFDIED
jgi:hypothetical protein